jgi:UDP-N-acetylmuramate--alanine ligase
VNGTVMGTRDLRALAAKGTIHFMGVGGAGMCALAEAVVRGGGRVTGCDARPGTAVHPLERLGVRVGRGHDPRHLQEVEALVVSAAIPRDHPEVQEAEAMGIPVLKRAEALGSWVDRGVVAAVAGTHGKTTTTALLTSILVTAGRNPTGFVGGEVAGWRSHLRAGGEDLFVVEADEYDRSFLHLRPFVTVVTNVEADHLDIYGSLEGVRDAFRSFLGGVSGEGAILACSDDPGAASLLPDAGARGRSYGLSAGSQLRAVGLRADGSVGGSTRFGIREDGVDRGRIVLPLPGLHNVRNALGAAAAARALGVEWPAIQAGLEGFQGVKRRFQLLGLEAGITVVDDYAHHPTEIAAALAAARSTFPGARVVAVFQPHLFSRTQAFHREFGAALAAADQVWVTEIYPAREAPIPGVDGELVAKAVRTEGTPVILHRKLDTLAAALAEGLVPGDVCVTLGAGSIEALGPDLLRRLGEGGLHA